MHISNVIELSISLALEIWLVVLLVRRRVSRRFPVFFAFIALETLAVAGRLIAIPNYRTYFHVYWSTEAVLLPFSLAALHEVFHGVFEGLFRLRGFRWFYYGTIVIVVAIAVRNAFVSPPAEGHPIISVILDVGIAINFVRMGIIGLFGAVDTIVDLEYDRYANGIVIGFGISSIGALIGYLAFSGFGTKVISIARNAPSVAYILGLAVWVASFIRPEPEGRKWEPPMTPEQMLAEVQGYLRALGISREKR